MKTQSDKIKTLTAYTGLSVLVHLLVLFSMGRFGSYTFVPPVNPLQAVMVDVAKFGDTRASVAASDQKADHADVAREDLSGDRKQAQDREVETPPAVPEKSPTEPKLIEPVASDKEKTASISRANEAARPPQPPVSQHTALPPAIPPPRGPAGEVGSAKKA